MDLNLFDVDITLGTPSNPCDCDNGFFRAEKDMLAEMDRFGIPRGVVRHVFSKEYAPVVGNKLLDELKSDRFEKCYTLLPHYSGEMGSDSEIVENLVAKKIKFVTFYPEAHNYYFSPHTCGPLLAELAEAEIVMLLEKGEVEYERIYEIGKAIPELPIIILNIAYRDNRNLYYLMEEIENFYIGISRFCGIDFIEDVVGKFGPERLIFSSNMPMYTPGGPIMSLLYAKICDDSKRMIAGNHIRSMIGEISEA